MPDALDGREICERRRYAWMLRRECFLTDTHSAPEERFCLAKSVFVEIGGSQIVQCRGDVRMFRPQTRLPNTKDFGPNLFRFSVLFFCGIQYGQLIPYSSGFGVLASQSLFPN